MKNIWIVCLLATQLSLAQKKIFTQQEKWVDSIYNNMSLTDKIGQLFMVAAYSNKDSVHNNSVEKLVTEQKVGGLIFFQGGPKRQAKLTNRYQAKAKVPLFIGIDAEWGLAMRIDSVQRFPWNMTLGAISNNKLIEKVGHSYANQSKRMGIHFNFAPVLDINTNPANPIIGNRSFGEDKFNVTEKASALVRGIQNGGIFATGKHFPGHGDTETDSHHTLPMLNFSRERIEDIELYPYKKLFQEGMASVMVAHLSVPSLEPREDYPTSISKAVVTDLLQKEMGFSGLIFTDALNMKGASNFKSAGEIDLEAFLAGNDILLFPENVPLAIEKICVAYQDSIVSEERLAQSVKKILNFKYKINLNKLQPIELTNLWEDLNPPSDVAMQYELYENAITVLQNNNSNLPIYDLANEKIAYVKLGDDQNTAFLETIKSYTEITEVNETDLDTLMLKLKDFTKVIVGFHKPDGAWRNHDFKPAEIIKLDRIAKEKNVILNVFAKPYSLLPLKDFAAYNTVVMSYQNSEAAQIVSAQLLFGAIEAKGQLPVSIGNQFKVGAGINIKPIKVLGYTLPENVGVNSIKLGKISEIVEDAIAKKIMPGAQVLVAKNGKVIFQKAYGFHTYDKKNAVLNSDLYDVASVTKIVATLPLAMQLFDNKKIEMDSKLGKMLPFFENSDKKNITFKELLSHYGKLQAWIPFYKATLDEKNQPKTEFYSKIESVDFDKKVADSLFIKKGYHEIMMKTIADSKLLSKKEYKYSDFTFIILKDIIENISTEKFENLSNTHFFKPLGMSSTMFNPLQKFSLNKIVPTEVDTYFRHQTIQGYVHDMAAAMDGGVAGHAGIFSNSIDLAKMMQMFLQQGNYGNKSYITSKTFKDFNTCYFCKEGNRRGLGFDKQQLPGNAGPTCGCASSESFGHTGFTGTMVWADPKEELIYIFLSNRTYPDSNAPNKLSTENIRENIQKVIYEAIER